MQWNYNCHLSSSGDLGSRRGGAWQAIDRWKENVGDGTWWAMWQSLTRPGGSKVDLYLDVDGLDKGGEILAEALIKSRVASVILNHSSDITPYDFFLFFRCDSEMNIEIVKFQVKSLLRLECFGILYYASKGLYFKRNLDPNFLLFLKF